MYDLRPGRHIVVCMDTVGVTVFLLVGGWVESRLGRQYLKGVKASTSILRCAALLFNV